MTFYALVGDDCEADGHPSECTEPAPGTIEDADSKQSLTLDGTAVADHGDRMHFDSHAHDYSITLGCHDNQSHDLVPDQTNPWTVDGRSLMAVGDSTTDPGSAGTAEITATTNASFEVVD